MANWVVMFVETATYSLFSSSSSSSSVLVVVIYDKVRRRIRVLRARSRLDVSTL